VLYTGVMMLYTGVMMLYAGFMMLIQVFTCILIGNLTYSTQMYSHICGTVIVVSSFDKLVL